MKKIYYSLVIALCFVSTGMKAQSVLAPNAFVVKYAGLTELFDDNQTTSTGRLEDGVLKYISANGAGAWNAIIRVTLAQPIDLSSIFDEQITIKGKQSGLSGACWRFQLTDADGSLCTVDSKDVAVLEMNGPDWLIDRFDLSSGWFEGGTVPGFDFSSVGSIAFVTTKALPAFTLSIESIHLGAETIALDATFESYTAADGLTISVNPAAPLIGANSFEFSEFAGAPAISGITTTMLDFGATFNFTGLVANKEYFLSLNDPLFYLNAPLTVSTSGISSVRCDENPVAVRYYNLQGVEISAPVKGQLYIAKEIYQSGAVKAKKTVK
jgi:hypothetical protein